MKLSLLALSALLGLSMTVAEHAEAPKKAEDAASVVVAKQYVVNFEDKATTQDFDAVSKWIKERNGEIVESINENFAKLIIAKMDESIMKLPEEFTNEIIESVEEDQMEWDEDEHDEL